jgi:hypothetical protein
VLAAGLESGGQTGRAGLQDPCAVGIQAPGFGELQKHGLRELVGVEIGGFLGLAQAVD